MAPDKESSREPEDKQPQNSDRPMQWTHLSNRELSLFVAGFTNIHR